MIRVCDRDARPLSGAFGDLRGQRFVCGGAEGSPAGRSSPLIKGTVNQHETHRHVIYGIPFRFVVDFPSIHGFACCQGRGTRLSWFQRLALVLVGSDPQMMDATSLWLSYSSCLAGRCQDFTQKQCACIWELAQDILGSELWSCACKGLEAEHIAHLRSA